MYKYLKKKMKKKSRKS